MKDQAAATPGAGPCPDREFVSCYLDRELATDTPESRHISGCARCGQTLEAYAKIGCGLKQELAAAVPEDLADRVRAKVRRRIDEEQEPQTYWLLWPARVAAVVALAVVATFAGYHLRQHRPAPADAATPPVVALAPTATPAMPNPSPQTRLPSADFAPASMGVTPFRFAPADANETRPALIPEAVRHVWLSDDPQASCAKFAALATAAGIKIQEHVAGETHQVVLVASRNQVVDLVRNWAKSGHRLLSPDQPQPEQNAFIGTGDEPVRYAAAFAPAQK